MFLFLEVQKSRYGIRKSRYGIGMEKQVWRWYGGGMEEVLKVGSNVVLN